jgi:hypothetical protein
MKASQAALALGLFLFSEIMPFLPFKSNGLLHASIECLHVMKVIPDDSYQRMRVAGMPTSNKEEIIIDIKNKSCGTIKIRCRK